MLLRRIGDDPSKGGGRRDGLFGGDRNDGAESLSRGEIIVADTNCIMAFAESCHLDIRRTGGLLGMVGGGEGFFNTTLTGPGLVILQSMNESTFRQALIANKVWRR